MPWGTKPNGFNNDMLSQCARSIDTAVTTFDLDKVLLWVWVSSPHLQSRYSKNAKKTHCEHYTHTDTHTQALITINCSNSSFPLLISLSPSWQRRNSINVGLSHGYMHSTKPMTGEIQRHMLQSPLLGNSTKNARQKVWGAIAEVQVSASEVWTGREQWRFHWGGALDWTLKNRCNLHIQSWVWGFFRWRKWQSTMVQTRETTEWLWWPRWNNSQLSFWQRCQCPQHHNTHGTTGYTCTLLSAPTSWGVHLLVSCVCSV